MWISNLSYVANAGAISKMPNNQSDHFSPLQFALIICIGITIGTGRLPLSAGLGDLNFAISPITFSPLTGLVIRACREISRDFLSHQNFAALLNFSGA